MRVKSKAEVLPLFNDERKDNCLRRLKAAEGQLRGVQEMIDSQRPCMEVLTQLAAAQNALRQVSRIFLRNYLQNCATAAIPRSPPTATHDLMNSTFLLTP